MDDKRTIVNANSDEHDEPVKVRHPKIRRIGFPEGTVHDEVPFSANSPLRKEIENKGPSAMSQQQHERDN